MNDRITDPSVCLSAAWAADLLADLADKLLALRSGSGAVYLYPHVSVDGDAIGSALALGLALEKAGVPFLLPLDEPIPGKLVFMPALDRITMIPQADPAVSLTGSVCQQIALAVDCSGADRLGLRRDLFQQAPCQMALDHHVSERPAGPGYIIDTTAAATGELVFDLIGCLEQKTGQALLDTISAALLMTAIVSDTGSFVYSNTSSRTFAIASRLMSYPLDLRTITYELFDRSSTAKLRLRGRIFSEAVFSHNGRIVDATVDQRLMDECLATDNDLDGIISDLRNVSGIDAAFLIRCRPDGSLRVNIRSSERFDAAAFAATFGGGGHPRAAGMTLSGMALDEAASRIRRKAGECL